MSAFLEAARAFLSGRRYAVAGLSHDQPNPGNMIYRKLRGAGFEVFPIHPSAEQIDGDRCYASVRDVAPLDGVIITTHPAISAAVVRDCIAAGVPRVWLHRSVGAGSVSADAVALCEAHGVALLDGGCPMMVIEPDFAHRCMRWVLDVRGRLPDGTRRPTAAHSA